MPIVHDANSVLKPLKSLAAGILNGAPNSSSTLINKFLTAQRELEDFKNGKPVVADGNTLSIAAIAAASRYHSAVVLDPSDSIKEQVAKSRAVIADKVANGSSVYGISTGFGGSADTRTDKPLLLGHALLQHQHVGVLPSSSKPLDVLPLLDPGSSTSMPEAWVRGAMLIRMNSLVRGHSGVRWELIEKINELIGANVTPVVPIRSSISASGDLSPLSYIAGTLIGNLSVRVFDGPTVFGQRKMVSSRDALAAHNITPISLASKEPLGILNGTAFSTSVAALALDETVQLAVLSQVCTAMGTEALLGTRANYDPFIHNVARPHPGQVECAQNISYLLQGSKLASDHEEEVTIEQDKYSLRQDRYPLRTSPQFLGPQIEDILSALSAVTQECNSTTDNPLIDGETGKTHHGGNFQAMAVTNAMEKTRLALHHIGKLLFSQCTELLNPAMNHGLPPSAAATDPSLNYHGKGLDIATAAYVAELGYLANPVSTHIQSAEMHNQAINSLALISARSTLNSIEVLSMLTASYIYILCQALDLRALQKEFTSGLRDIVTVELQSCLQFSSSHLQAFSSKVFDVMESTLNKSSVMDAADQMRTVAASSVPVLVDLFSRSPVPESSVDLAVVSQFKDNVATRATQLLNNLRGDYLSGERGEAPASLYLGRTRGLYEFVRVTLGIKMHGRENFANFESGIGSTDVTIGQNISLIYEAIRDGQMRKVLVDLFEA